MASFQQEIAIIGSGLSGLCFALHLAKRNIKSTIYEFRSATYTRGSDIVLYPSAGRVLDHIGLYETLLKKGYESEQLIIMNQAGVILGAMPQGKVFGYSCLRIRRRVLKQELVQECEKKGVRIIFGKKVKHLEEGSEKVHLHFEDGDTVKADMVIGADGLRSITRNYIHPNAKPEYTGIVIVYGCISALELDANMREDVTRIPMPSLHFGREGSFSVWPRDAAAQEIGFFVNLRLQDRSRGEWKKFDEDKEGIRKLIEGKFGQVGWPEQIQVICRNAEAEEFKPWIIHTVPSLPTWRSPSNKVVLIGDAAHAIPPLAGLGGSMALEDGETLAIAISNISDDPKSLQKWEAHRQLRIKQVVNFTNMAVKLRDTSAFTVVEWIREWFIWGLLKVRGPEGNKWLYRYDGEVEIAKL